MIIFDLDGTLANCEHRRHFVDPKYRARCGHCFSCEDPLFLCIDCKQFYKNWKPDWRAFYDACDEDAPIKPVVRIWNSHEADIACDRADLYIWSDRCESVRYKTIEWLSTNLFIQSVECLDSILKLRPIGDDRPQEELFQGWLDDFVNSNEWCRIAITQRKCPLEMVFSSHKPTIDMFRKRGVFVFDCNQQVL